ncbi:cathepsin B-like cysteine proteinase 4 [Adelges cooleyi]|uniref:cathepsin B-like cysteine proteinase 4 n=1 Tax=Adelges cooleyi TaxID=133065 RepID=UPI002180340E|nr:cathepsin B-like cysteine proteinase 4 [Adelges cooleyi]
MSRVIILLSVVLFSVYQTEQSHFLTDDYIDQINAKATTWKAGRNFPSDISVEQIKSMLGARDVGLTVNGPVKSEDKNYANYHYIPRTFDARKKWKNCKTIGHIRDQGKCGSCWALATTSAFSDRMCIASDDDFNHMLSAEELAFCCRLCGFGCSGGYPIQAWKYFSRHGIVTGGDYGSDEGCQPYNVPPCEVDDEGQNTCKDQPAEKNHRCTKECYGDSNIDYKNDHVYTRDAYYLAPNTIQKDILTYGPVAAAFDVYDDFIYYKEGVYVKTENATYLGGHAVKMIGWGYYLGTPYWLMVNSWNTQWGDNGTFKILRGNNECGIDNSTTAGVTKY